MKYLGNFTLPHGESVVGELLIAGRRTALTVHSENVIPQLPPKAVITGHAYSGKALTLFDCISYDAKTTHSPTLGVRRHQHSAYINHVVMGPRHLDPQAATIRAIEFSTSDLSAIFYDPLAFGVVAASRNLIDTVLAGTTRRSVETGDGALIAYYSGKSPVITIQTVLGTITVEHRPAFGGGASKGVDIKDQLTLCVLPDAPIRFDQVLEYVHDLATFLSVASGRSQAVHRVRISTNDSAGSVPETFDVRSSFGWRMRDAGGAFKPYWKDLPLDPVGRPAEFSSVLANWLKSRGQRRIARARYLDGLRKANSYGYDRLVAAANMFDLLPKDAVPVEVSIGPELEKTRAQCVAQLKRHPKSIDRDSAISALGRLGKPSLPKKVEHHVAIVSAKMGPHFPDLAMIARYAVQCRNAFVHGNTSEFDLAALEKFVPFFTETLEFIFAASDLVDSGWDAAAWASRPLMAKHSFTRYRLMYRQILPQFHAAISKPKEPATENLGGPAAG